MRARARGQVRGAAGSRIPQVRGVVKSSFPSLSRADNVYATKNGMVHACIEAYNHHHNLVLRPDDVWCAIIAQLGVYIKSTGSDLREILFEKPRNPADRPVNLHVQAHVTPDSDHGQLAFMMINHIQSLFRDPLLRDWIMPAFSTTTKIDEAAAAVLMMGTMQHFFTYSWGAQCGIPSVTLLGDVDDWMVIRDRVYSYMVMGQLGDGAAAFGRILIPVLESFIESFRNPRGEAALAFWRSICVEHTPEQEQHYDLFRVDHGFLLLG